ncbi:MAG: 3-isopropylmalate dehydratase small subunit [Acidaminococcaceae bacterium]|nr:3-isopropylmalate dehydratase small subunit [Acidaminococcaceae bacterium]
MKTVAEGVAYVFGNNIDTDQIYPGKYVEFTEMEDIRQYAMSGSEEPDLAKVFQPGDIIVAGTNFGCGSSREHAAMTLKGIAVGAILAESFGRIFYRNAINLGIPAITCKGIRSLVHRGDKVRIDFTTGEIVNETTGKKAKAEPMNEYMMSILQNGGIKPMIRKMQEDKKKKEL